MIWRAEKLSFGYGGRSLVQGLNLGLAEHELLLVSGANGVGKSTLLQVLLGFGPAKVFSGSMDLMAKQEEIAWLPQLDNPEFHLPLTLRDVLEISLFKHLSDESILEYGLLRKEHLPLSWNRASGGERKRTLLTRAFLHRPRLLLLDEPLNHLDAESRTVVTRGLSEYLKTHPCGAVVISHDAWSGQELSLFRMKSLEIGVAGHQLKELR